MSEDNPIKNTLDKD